MSHFTVLVITDEDTNVDYLLAPFDENADVEPYISHFRKDIPAKMRADFEDTKQKMEEDIAANSTQSMMFCADYTVEGNCWEKEFITREIADKFAAKVDAYTDEELYEQFLAYWGVNEDDIDENGNVLSTYNPNSKWDWYQVGGRWDGIIRTRDGEYVNSCLVDDIDWSIDPKDAARFGRFWDVVVDGAELAEGEDPSDYSHFYKKEYYIERYGNRQNYIKDQASFGTYAVLTPDGKWHEAGKMGWWGISLSTPEDQRTYADGYEKLVRAYENQECYATVVDCHI